ncbi:MAG: PTS sugar transporter subunit IIC [Firmicutes bacterium]|nr:PTS sugar transporter subunit IIC [Bacillota bacterium]
MKKIIGVAACPAGIAHTYLATESLEQAAKQLGYEVKIETNGAGGVENRLTETDIAEATAVIIAADTTVDKERFRGKPMLEVSVGEAIKHAAKIIQKVEAGELETY